MDDLRRFQVGMPLEAEGWIKIAKGFAAAGRLTEALKTLQRAKLCCPPDNQDLLKEIDSIHSQMEPETDDVPRSSSTGVMVSTLEHMETSLRTNPRQADKLMLLSELYWRGGRRIDSIDALWHALMLTPDSLETGMLLAERLLDVERPGAAQRVANQISIAPATSTAGELRLVRLLRRAELKDAAIARLEKLAALDPRAADVQYELGVTYAAINHPVEAAQALNNALSLRPGWKDATLALVDVYNASGRAWEARALKMQIEKPSPESEDPTVDISDFIKSQEEAQKVNGFTGRLQLLPVPELLQFLGQRRLTGMLRISAGDRVGSIEILDGSIVSADLTGEPTFSDRVLGARIALREELALEEKGTRCCIDLLAKKPASIGALERECRTQCETVLGRLIQWTDGQIDFVAQSQEEKEPPFRFDVTFLLLETMRKMDEASDQRPGAG